jgi:hypothetical protein
MFLDIFNEQEKFAFVFSHPNHELALLGVIRRLKPHRIIYITDGGSQVRCNETRDVLHELDLIKNSIFMGLSENSFYDAILNIDCNYFKKIAKCIANHLGNEALSTYSIFCDAVEFYNPIHDMTLPIVRSLQSFSRVFEIPLIYQNATREFIIQKPPEDLREFSTYILLVEDETRLKKCFFESKYNSLGDEMNYLIERDQELTKYEWFMKGRECPISPMKDQIIRYDERGRELASRRIYSRSITYQQHYFPLVTTLLKYE